MKDIVITENLVQIKGNVTFNKDAYTSVSHAVIDIKEIQSIVYTESRQTFSLVLGIFFLILSGMGFLVSDLSIYPIFELRNVSVILMVIAVIFLLFYFLTKVVVCCINGTIFYKGFSNIDEYQLFADEVMKKKRE